MENKRAEKKSKSDRPREIRTIDATDRILGRLATEIALILRGKNRPDFRPDRDQGGLVIIKNVDKLKFTGKKMDQKKYYHHSEYLGGLKIITLRQLFQEKPEEVLKKAVWGMLPKNKLRAKMIRRLKIEKIYGRD